MMKKTLLAIALTAISATAAHADWKLSGPVQTATHTVHQDSVLQIALNEENGGSRNYHGYGQNVYGFLLANRSSTNFLAKDTGVVFTGVKVDTIRTDSTIGKLCLKESTGATDLDTNAIPLCVHVSSPDWVVNADSTFLNGYHVGYTYQNALNTNKDSSWYPISIAEPGHIATGTYIIQGSAVANIQ